MKPYQTFTILTVRIHRDWVCVHENSCARPSYRNRENNTNLSYALNVDYINIYYISQSLNIGEKYVEWHKLG